jgi:hypothetical protein
MISEIKLHDIVIEITRKKMKNIRLRIYPNGQVKISAPLKIDPVTLIRTQIL